MSRYKTHMFSANVEEFESWVKEGVEAIPEKFRSRIANVAFLVDEEPTKEQRKQNRLRSNETLLGLYEGIPRPARGEGYGGLVMPDRITIFKKQIEEAAIADMRQFGASAEVFREMVRKLVIDTVWHEVAHHFGLDEVAVRQREKQRSKK